MNRPPVTVVVVVGGTERDLRACLDGVRDSVRGGDEVLVVTPQHRVALRQVLAAYSSLVTADLGVGQDVAACRRLAAQRARYEIVVFVDGDTVVSAHWLDPVVAAFDDPNVVAAGPRCHLSLGPQGVDLPDDARANVAAFKRHAREWRAAHRGARRTVDRLGPVCAAVRAESLARAGGPGLDLPYQQLRELGEVVVVEESLVAHVAGPHCALREPADPNEPLLSVCMIVKDEERVLADALRSVEGLADEVLVYDTGSTDRTREIATEHGARVVEGFWDDHFGDARNRALAHCHGRWALIVDADDIVEADPAELRAALAYSTVEGYVVTVENVLGLRATRRDSFLSCRLFPRRLGVYAGRLHEQVVSRVTGALISGVRVGGLVVQHSGYQQVSVAERDKFRRNLDLAALAARDAVGGRYGSAARTRYDLARSLYAAGRETEALAETEAALAGPVEGYFRRRLIVLAVRAAIKTADVAIAEQYLSRLPGEVSGPLLVECLRAEVLAARGDTAEALALIAGLPETAEDDDGMTIGRDTLGELELRLLGQTGQHALAGDRLVALVLAGIVPIPLADALDVLDRAGRGFDALSGAAGDTRAELLLQAAGLPAERADRLLEALWSTDGAGAVLAVAARLAPELSLLRALEWSGRLREQGLNAHCPLLAIAGATRRAVTDRVLAAAIAFETFRDEEAFVAFSQVLGDVPAHQEAVVLEQLRLLAPRLADLVQVVPAG